MTWPNSSSGPGIRQGGPVVTQGGPSIPQVGPGIPHVSPVIPQVGPGIPQQGPTISQVGAGIPPSGPSPGSIIPRHPGPGVVSRMPLSARQEYDAYIQNKLRMIRQPTRPILVQQVRDT